MSGIENFNRERFFDVANNLRVHGYFVNNPAEISGGDDWKWEDYMKKAIRKMMEADALFVLEGYETSRGANIEIKLAKQLGMEVFFERPTTNHQKRLQVVALP